MLLTQVETRDKTETVMFMLGSVDGRFFVVLFSRHGNSARFFFFVFVLSRHGNSAR